MDPLTQGIVGAIFAQNFLKKTETKAATLAGILGGMAPDLDALIHSKTDHLLNIEYHRHFSHSLTLVPVIAAPIATLIYFLFKKTISFKRIYLYTFLGTLSHGLLDACTSYGTQLLWPWSNARIAWNNISIIDPLFTLPLLLMVLWVQCKSSIKWARLSAIYMFSFLLFGLFQNTQAKAELENLARSRGHQPVRLEVKPSFGNIWLWRGIYENSDHQFFVEAIWTLPGFGNKIYVGKSVKRWLPEREIPNLDPNSVLARDIQRFAWFSDNYLAEHPDMSTQIGDLRYATLPHSIKPLWALEVIPHLSHQHAALNYFRNLEKSELHQFKKMLLKQEIP